MRAIRIFTGEEIEVREIPQDELDYTVKPFCPRCTDRVNHYECEEEKSIYCPKELRF